MKKMLMLGLALGMLLSVGTLASAAEKSMPSTTKLIEHVQKVVAECLTDGGSPVAIAIASPTGEIIFFVRMDNTVERAAPIAKGKAKTSALMGSSTRAFHERLQKEKLTLADFCQTGLTSFVGGIPIVIDGVLVGAVGVSGRHPDKDEVVAQKLVNYIIHKK